MSTSASLAASLLSVGAKATAIQLACFGVAATLKTELFCWSQRPSEKSMLGFSQLTRSLSP